MAPGSRRIVVIGREGQVARALGEVLRATGHAVIDLARPEFDLASPGPISNAIVAAAPDVVINPAAYTAVDRAEDEPELARAINALGAEAVARAAAHAGAPVIHFSTDYVFDGAKSEAYTETDATGPLGVYGATKLEGEERVAAANPRHVILRTAWVCSPYGNNFVKTMLRLSAERPELRVVDDQHGSPTFAGDLAEATSKLIANLTAAAPSSEMFGIFHMANAGRTTWCRFARAILDGAAERGGRSVPVHAITTADYPTKARRPACSLLSTEKIKAVHGITMRPWEAGLEDCLDALLGEVHQQAR